MYRHAIKSFDFSSFLSKKEGNRITRLKRNERIGTGDRHCVPKTKGATKLRYIP